GIVVHGHDHRPCRPFGRRHLTPPGRNRTTTCSPCYEALAKGRPPCRVLWRACPGPTAAGPMTREGWPMANPVGWFEVSGPDAGGPAGHDPGRVRVAACLRDGPAGTGRHARGDRAGDVHAEKLTQRPAEHIPVHVVAHGLPPEGPKRSVLMAPVPWPARTSR